MSGGVQADNLRFCEERLAAGLVFMIRKVADVSGPALDLTGIGNQGRNGGEGGRGESGCRRCDRAYGSTIDSKRIESASLRRFIIDFLSLRLQ